MYRKGNSSKTIHFWGSTAEWINYILVDMRKSIQFYTVQFFLF